MSQSRDMLNKLRIYILKLLFYTHNSMEKVYIVVCHRYVIYTPKRPNYIMLYILMKSCRGQLMK